MREHFKTEHFLCEEEECANEEFTAVFRSEIDLRAHIATAHSRNMSKMDLKQARTLDLEFSYTPRERGGGGGQENNRRGGRSRQNDPQREFDRIAEQQQPIVQQPPIRIDSKNEEQFPSLGPTVAGHSVQLANTVRHINYGTSGLARTKENFPSLGGLPLNEKVRVQNQPTTSGKQYKVPSASSMLKGPGGSKSKSSNNRPPSSGGLKKDPSDFPALAPSMSSPSSSSYSRPAVVPQSSSFKPRPVAVAPSNAGVKKITPDFPSSSRKNRSKNEQLLEDLILPTTTVDLNLVRSKHRGLVEDYVSMASTVSKVQTVKQKDIQSVPEDFVKKNVPKLNSNDNFPTLGGSSAVSAPQWLAAKPTPQPKQEAKEAPKKTKKTYDVPVKNTPNGYKKSEDVKQANNGSGKEKTKLNNGNKENKNENVLTGKNFPTLGSESNPPPGFTQPIKKPPPGFSNISSVNEVGQSTSDSVGEYRFLAPSNAGKRNQALVGEFTKALTTPEKMQEFRHVSTLFRDGNYFPKSYYETCKHVLGAGFDSIFPELLALLPDIEKQQVRAKHLIN